MKRYLFISLTLMALSASGQVTISIATGVGKYAMDNLKDFQQDFIDRYGVVGGINAAFPAYLYYEGSVGYSYSPRLYSEIFFTYGSTGGRVSYADYSGHVTMTQKVNYKSLTGSLGIRWQRQSFQFEGVVRMGPVYSSLILDQVESVGSDGWSHHGKYESVGYMLEPNFKVTRISGMFGIFASLGLNSTVRQSYFESVEYVDYISTPQGTYMKVPDWSGLRIGIGVTFIIGSEKEAPSGDKRIDGKRV